MPSNKVLAIDPGFDRFGIALMKMEKNRPVLLYSTCLVASVRKKKAESLLKIGQELEKIIEKWRPENLAIETLFFNSNVTSAIGVAEARGIAIYESAKAGLKIFEYSPQAVKIAVTGYGRADKRQIENMLKKLVNLPERSTKRLDDEMDAIALGITHLATQKGI